MNYKRTLFIIPLVLMSLVSFPSWGELLENLVKRDGIWLIKFNENPFTGRITNSQIQGTMVDGKYHGERLEWFGGGYGKKLPVAEGGGFNSHDLRRLGRDEGRALKSEQILLAITPWCHVYVSKRRLEELEPGDISVLCGAFEDGLRSIIKS